MVIGPYRARCIEVLPELSNSMCGGARRHRTWLWTSKDGPHRPLESCLTYSLLCLSESLSRASSLAMPGSSNWSVPLSSALPSFPVSHSSSYTHLTTLYDSLNETFIFILPKAIQPHRVYQGLSGQEVPGRLTARVSPPQIRDAGSSPRHNAYLALLFRSTHSITHSPAPSLHHPLHHHGSLLMSDREQRQGMPRPPNFQHISYVPTYDRELWEVAVDFVLPPVVWNDGLVTPPDPLFKS